MKKLNTLRKAVLIRNAVGFMIIGAIFIVLSVLIMRAPERELIPITVTIVDIQEERDIIDDEIRYAVFVDYEVNGKEYKNIEYGAYDSSMEVGGTTEAFYDASDPTLLSSTESNLIVYVILVVGIAAFAFGVIGIVKSVKQKADDLDEYNRVDMSKVSEDVVEEIASSDEPVNTYYFRFVGKFPKTNYVLEDDLKRVIYEANMEKVTALKPFTFTFINHLTQSVKSMQIGHNVQTDVGLGNGFNVRVPVKNSFTVDGKRNWDYLAEHGYGFDCRLNGINPCFDVMHYGVKVAYIETTGADPHGDKTSLLYKLPVNGMFRVECRNSDLDMVFMTCFSIARAIFYEN